MSSIIIDPRTYPVNNVLDILLIDRTTRKNIIFATDSYAEKGELYTARCQISRQLLESGRECIIQPRVLKALEEQQSRTRKRAEVFTPAWVCCMMNDHIDEEWYGFQKNLLYRCLNRRDGSHMLIPGGLKSHVVKRLILYRVIVCLQVKQFLLVEELGF